MATALPARNIFDGTANPTTGTMKAAQGNQRDYLAGLLGDDGTAETARATLGVPASAGFRNRIINGGCQIARRGNVNAVLASNVYGGADRIFVAPQSFSTMTGVIQAVAMASAKSGTSQGIVLTTTGSGSVNFGTRIESADVIDLAGAEAIVSVLVAQNTGVAQTANIFVYTANTKNNFSAATLIASTSFSSNVPSGVATPLSLPIDASAMTNAGRGIQVLVAWQGVGAVTSRTFQISDFQLLPGSVVTQFEPRPVAVEMGMCYRYYRTIGIDIAGYGSASMFPVHQLTLGTTMFSNPSITTLIAPSLVNCSGFGVSLGAQDGNSAVLVSATVTAAGSYSFSGGRIALSAEL